MALALTMEGVEVSVQSFAGLFSDAIFPLDIDTYQRPYVWSTPKVDQLISDLREYAHAEDSLDYYMGAVLLHENHDKQKLFIIDGQQRLTSLSILYYTLTGRVPSNHALSYRSAESARNIKQAQARFADSGLQPFDNTLFERICFAVITVPLEDLAFTFFNFFTVHFSLAK